MSGGESPVDVNVSISVDTSGGVSGSVGFSWDFENFGSESYGIDTEHNLLF